MSAYRQFVKEHIHEFDHLPKQTDRMRAVASLYRKHMGMPAKAKSTKPAKSTKSKGGVMTAGSVDKPELLEMGLQVHEKKQKGRPKKIKETKKEPEPSAQLPVPQPQPEPEPETVIINPEPKPVKPKRVQSEKQKAAFLLLQEKRKQQVEKQKLVKKIEASKLLLENDVKLKASKSKKA